MRIEANVLEQDLYALLEWRVDAVEHFLECVSALVNGRNQSTAADSDMSLMALTYLKVALPSKHSTFNCRLRSSPKPRLSV